MKSNPSVVDAQSQKRTIQSDSSKPIEPVKLGPIQTQISFQVPVNWNAQGSKSLLDSSKALSLVSLNTPDTNARSLLQSNETLTSQSGIANITVPKVTIPAASNAATKTYITGNKVFGNLTGGQVINTTTTGLMTVTKPGQTTSIARLGKGSSFMISNKQYTIVPSNSAPVVTQFVKTEKLSKGKVTMAEAQIMLPTGPAKISWPLQAQTATSDSKHILITTPVSRAGQHVMGKTITARTQMLVTTTDTSSKISDSSSVVPTATVVDVGSSKNIIMTTISKQAVNQKISVPKTSIIPAQKNWELVKQSSRLLPHRLNKSPITPAEPKASDTKPVSDLKPVLTSNTTGTSAIKEEDVDKYKSKFKSESKKDCNENKQTQKVGSNIKIEANTNMNVHEPMQMKNSNESVKLKVEKEEDSSKHLEVDKDKTEKVENGDDKTDGTEKQDVEFNAVDAMTWKDGVGELPGSNLKVRRLVIQTWCN